MAHSWQWKQVYNWPIIELDLAQNDSQALSPLTDNQQYTSYMILQGIQDAISWLLVTMESSSGEFTFTVMILGFLKLESSPGATVCHLVYLK